MKNKLITILIAATMVLSLTACDDGVVENAETKENKTVMFEEHKLDDYCSIFVDKETGVCYFSYSRSQWNSGITVMLNADGTPKIWEE